MAVYPAGSAGAPAPDSATAISTLLASAPAGITTLAPAGQSTVPPAAPMPLAGEDGGLLVCGAALPDPPPQPDARSVKIMPNANLGIRMDVGRRRSMHVMSGSRAICLSHRL